MLLTDDMRDLLELFERHEVSYAVVGGFAVNYYGYARLTQDFDVLVEGSMSNGERVVAALRDFGFGGVGIEPGFFARSGVALHLGVEPNRIDILTSLTGASSEELISSSRRIETSGVSLRIISKPDLIRTKRSSNRLRDKADAEELEKLPDR
ncbi:MAG: hypothetical protein R6V85_19745 [Polyangia bacterium]